MPETWITDLTHFLDEEGELVSEPPQAKRMAGYIASIVLMASYPGPDYPPEYRVSCCRRAEGKVCQEEIAGFIDPETNNIMWLCPGCGARGYISNWRGTAWDLSEVTDIDH